MGETAVRGIIKLIDCRLFSPFLSDISVYGTDGGILIREDFWIIVEAEGNKDEYPS